MLPFLKMSRRGSIHVGSVILLTVTLIVCCNSVHVLVVWYVCITDFANNLNLFCRWLLLISPCPEWPMMAVVFTMTCQRIQPCLLLKVITSLKFIVSCRNTRRKFSLYFVCHNLNLQLTVMEHLITIQVQMWLCKAELHYGDYFIYVLWKNIQIKQK